MNAKKNRYAVRISETDCRKIQEQALHDGAIQGIAVALVALDKVFGWRKARLKHAMDAIESMLMLSVFDMDITAADAVDYLRSEYDIDCDKLPIEADASGDQTKQYRCERKHGK